MSPFGRSLEKLAHKAEQLELALEALETDQAERLVTAVAAGVETANEAQAGAALIPGTPTDRGSALSSPFRMGPADSSEVGPVQPQCWQVSTAPLPRAQRTCVSAERKPQAFTDDLCRRSSIPASRKGRHQEIRSSKQFADPTPKARHPA
jgi:hypothetical protein